MRYYYRIFPIMLAIIFLVANIASAENGSKVIINPSNYLENSTENINLDGNISFLDREVYESTLFTLNKKLQSFKEFALQIEDDSLARQIDNDYNSLSITLNALNGSWKPTSTKDYKKNEESIDDFYLKHAIEFEKVLTEYEKIIEYYSSIIPSFNGKSSTSMLAVSSQLILNSPIDVKLTTGMYQVYSFTPTVTTTYRIFTGPYGGTGFNNDTVLELYSDAGLTKLLKSGDDDAGGVTSGFSEVIMTLTKGATYYVKLRPYSISGAVEARLLVQLYKSSVTITDPINVTIDAGDSRIIDFTPKTSGIYKLFTTQTSNASYSDSVIQVYNDETLTTLLAYNNDANSQTVLSEFDMKMVGGHRYYIKLYNFDASRILIVKFSIVISLLNYNVIAEDSLENVDVDIGNLKIFEFTPSTTGRYRISTGTYNGKFRNDTVLYLYSDANLTQQIGFGDDYYGYFDRYAYSEIVYKLNAGTKYYVQVTGYNNSSVSASFTIKRDENKYVYDDNGRLMDIYLSSGGKYRDDGTTINSYLPSGGKKHYTYDRNGNRIKVEYFDFF